VRAVSTTIHIGIAKWRDWKGTDAELADAIRRDPRDIFVLDPTCDRQGADGACQGHDMTGAEGAA
jgi:hypothetical protein